MDARLALDALWLLVCAALVYIMQAGFMCLEAGITREKNNINVAIKNMCDFGISVMFFWAVGFAFMFGTSMGGGIGSDKFFGGAYGPELFAYDRVFFVFQVMFCGTAVSIISGAVAERLRFNAYLFIALLTAGFLYPIVGHWCWNGLPGNELTGWLGEMGFVDFAGSTVVHSVGGWIALAAVLIIGPRAGRFPESGEARRFNANNLPLSVLGALLLWFGWFGFNGGSVLKFDETVPLVLQNTLLAGAAGVAGAIALGLLWDKKINVFYVINGTLGGLVAITAGCHAVTSPEAVIIGALGGGVVMFADNLLEKNRIDDVVGAIPVHLGAGIWGTLAVALFGDPELLGTGLSLDEQLITQIIGIASVGGFVFVSAYAAFVLVNQFWPMRISPIAEEIGLNVAEHDANTDLRDLLAVMSDQAKSADLTKRAEQDPFTQTGMIGLHYNNLIFNLERSIEKTDELLTNVIPAQVATRLKEGEEIADSYNEVSVLFADLVGFTELTQRLVARRVVTTLNDIFSSFDVLAQQHRIEKVKTIGDGYMAVSGVFDWTEDHAERAARMALAMHEALERYNEDSGHELGLRIGINSGPVIAGVIGTSRFLYDMWGDTVNTASRMESSGVPGRTQVTEKTYDLLRSKFRFEARDPIEVKGKGVMKTFILLGEID